MIVGIIALSAIAVLFFLYLFMLAPGRLADHPKGLWAAKYAHRGLHNREKTIPENSLAAFAAAAEAGYGIELDINLTADSKVVVFHDDTLERICGSKKVVCECTYEELSQYRILNTSEKIPLFSEALELLKGRVPLIIELKNTPKYKELCRLTEEMLKGYEGLYCIESFHPGIVRWFLKNAPQIIRGQLATGTVQYSSLPRYQAALLSNLLTNLITRPHFAAYDHRYAHKHTGLFFFKRMGGKRIAWTVRDTDDIAWCNAHFDAVIFEFYRP